MPWRILPPELRGILLTMSSQDDLREFLIESYCTATAALWDYERATDEGDLGGAKDRLLKATDAVCNALRRTAEEDEFWQMLAALRQPIQAAAKNIRSLVDDVDLFLSLEKEIFSAFNLGEPFTRRLLEDQALVLNNFLLNPEEQALALRGVIKDAQAATCGLIDGIAKVKTRDRLINAAVKTSIAISAVGSLAAIAINAATYVKNPYAINSVVTGLGGALGFAVLLQRRR